MWTLVIALVMLIYLCAVGRYYLGERWSDSGSVDDLQRAVAWLPRDASAFQSLGLQLSRSPAQYERAIAALRRSTELDPYDGGYWLDLASVCDLAGQPAERDRALESALHAEPNNPDVAAEAANYYLTSGNTSRALLLLRQALERDPSSAQALLPTFWRATRDAQLLLNSAIPNPTVQLEFLHLMVDQKQSVAAQAIWKRLLDSAQKSPRSDFHPEQTFFYFDYLLRDHNSAAFAADWNELAQTAPALRAYLPSENLIVNGGFELPVLDAGLDWKFEPVAHVTAVIDNTNAHTGSRSLSLTYDGEAAYQAGWREFVPVKPGADYKFTAWIKSDNLTSSSGPRIALVDAFTDSVLFLSKDTLDTHPWQQIGGPLHIPETTTLVAVEITRSPANTRISGKAWIDDLSLEQNHPVRKGHLQSLLQQVPR